MMNQSTPLIALRQVCKEYHTPAGAFPALKDISLEFFRGEFVGIVGKSGAGKSTLLNMITGVDHLTGGEVLAFDDNQKPFNIHRLSENDLARWRGRNLGIVYQSFQLLPMLTLLENVMLPVDLSGRFNSKQTAARAMDLLEMVEIGEHAYKLPSLISGGQQQRVAIARALANDPPIIVADEPTGSLDSVTAETIFELFEKLVQDGKTVIMVTHDNSLGPRFSRRLFLRDGEIADIDSLDETVQPGSSHASEHFDG